MTELTTAVVSVTRTKRRRYLWCAWWTSPPSFPPFRNPDAWEGGARSAEEAHAAAEKAAGRSLQLVDGKWAAAFLRLRAGLLAFPSRGAADAEPNASARKKGAPPAMAAHLILGVSADAPRDEVVAAFRRRVLEVHPDHGGSAEAFIALKRAYDRLIDPARKRRRHS